MVVRMVVKDGGKDGGMDGGKNSYKVRIASKWYKYLFRK